MSNTVVNTFEPTCTSTSAQIKTFLILLDLLRLVLRDYFWTSLYLFPDDYFWNLPLLHSQENTFGPTSTSHRALELVAVVAVVLAVALRNTYCCFLYSSPVRNICSSAWNSLTTSPYKRKTISLNIARVFFIHVLVLNWSYALWLKFMRSKYISFLISLCKSDIGWNLFQSVQKNLKSLLLSEHPPCFLCSPEIRSSSSR